MNYFSFIISSIIALMMTCFAPHYERNSPFLFKETDKGIELFEDGKPVFFYQRMPKALTGNHLYSNYIHPLYSLSGDTLTEEFPSDHPFHRGIFWAWHQLYVNNINLGDGWINDGILQDVTDIETNKNNGQAKIMLNVLWKSSNFKNGEPFMNEHTSITVHPLESGIRIIDFKITLNALVEGLQIGGSADEKGYGGFCARIKLTDSIHFTSENGPVSPEELQVKAGSWMDFSAAFGRDKTVSGLTILCHPGNPDYPEPWILRQKGSMQNVVFPGQKKFSIGINKPLVLRYRLIIHNGNADSTDIRELLLEYGKLVDAD